MRLGSLNFKSTLPNIQYCQMFLGLFLILLPLIASTPLLSQEQCFAKHHEDFYSLISTLTPYDRVRGNGRHFKGCEPQKLWLFQRHATRFPHVAEIEKYSNLTILRDMILENHAQGRGELCPDDLEELKGWELVADVRQSMLLTSSGIEELRQRGRRLYADFNQLFRNKSQVDIRFTSKERTRQSAEAVTKGIFHKPMKFPDSMIYDELIKNERNCPAWQPSTENSKLHEEVGKLIKSPEMQKLISSVSQRLGFEEEMDFETIKDIYNICRFEYSWYHSGRFATWCSAFTEEDLKLMEYWQDVTYYYKSGYGNELIVKLGCEFIKDIISRFSSDEKKATLYFGHSSTNRKLLTALGLAKGEPLRGDGYLQSKHREWRTTYLMPFAANVMAVLYKCEKETKTTNEKLRVAVFVNEKLARIPACGKREMCGFEEFKEKFSNITNPQFCNRDFCYVGHSESQPEDFFP